MAKKPKNGGGSAGCNPLTSSIKRIRGYPDKLIYFHVASSPYFWARTYQYGKYFTKSLKTTDPAEAKERCIEFYNDKLLNGGVGKGSVNSRRFASIGNQMLEIDKKRTTTRQSYDDFNRFKKRLVPFFGEVDIGNINNAKLREFLVKLQNENLSPATIKQYFQVLKKIFKYAVENEIIKSIPPFPKILGANGVTKRDWLELEEYKTLCDAADKMAKNHVEVRGVPVTEELKLLMQFMVNCFIRPSDLRNIKFEHIQVKENPKATKADEKRYLLLKHPKSKVHDNEVVSMPRAVFVFESLLALMKKRKRVGKTPSGKPERGYYGKPGDYLFFPEYSNRTTAMAVIGRQFRKALEEAKLQTVGDEKHSLYSLRHSAIMFRLTKGDVDTLTLAKNARTSQLMIERFYASRLTPQMNLDKLHSFKK